MYKLFYSPILRSFLQKLISNKIAEEILIKEYSLINCNINCLDLDSEGYLSFIQADKANKLLIENKRKALNSWDTLDNVWAEDMSNSNSIYGVWIKSRNKIKIGRFVKQLFFDTFSNKEIEDFVNLVKSKQNTNEDFHLVKGKDISYWYNEENYYYTTGDLGKSCMRYNKCESFLKIYENNPKCQLLILKKEDKILGRSIIWKVDYKSEKYNFEYMMDRVYTNNYSDILKFHEYAKLNNWVIKYKNTYSDMNEFVLNEQRFTANVNFKLNPQDYDKYPYMDTYKFYNPETGMLQNFHPNEKGFINLERIDGGLRIYYLYYYSNYYRENICEIDCIWSEVLQDYLYTNSVIEVTQGSNIYKGIYPNDYFNIIYDTKLGINIHIDDTVFSEHYDTYIFKENSEILYILDLNYKIIKNDWVYKQNNDNDIIINDGSNTEISNSIIYYKII